MNSSFSASSRRSYDIPKPETGLAEWTSKIKALQREVDADEEVEQKRLEEEISAARQARLRRSRGAGAGGRVDSVDMSSNKEELQRLGSLDDTVSNDTPKSVAERAIDQETALRRLMGRNDVYNPDKISGSTPSRANTDPSNSTSLASFIGGRASGPRLNRHPPQQDAHDPTQFIQPDLSAPHPVFGKGGIAMPGMAAKRENKGTSSIAGTELSERYQPSSAKSTPFKPSSVSPATSSQYSTAALEPNKQDNVDLYRRSFTSKTSSSSNFLSSNESSKVESSNDISARLRNESSPPNQTSYTSAYQTNALNAPPKKEKATFRDSPSSFSTSADTFRSTAAPAAAKPIPSYLGTSYTSKPSSTSNTPKKAESSVNTTTTPLRRLMETNNVYNPDKLDTPRKSIAERAQSVSLAGFMGGNASGIRLNKHAPQPDAHDPTQFIQLDTSAPHPVFGRGGVAMPGLVTRKTEATPSNDSAERYRPSGTKAIWPPVQTAYTEKVQDVRSISPQKTGNRERTLSTPGSRSNPVSSSSHSSDTWSASSNNMGRRSPSKDSWAVRDRTISTPSNHNIVTSSINTPSLARPIQPIPKSASISPLISTATPSPAFQKPAPSKDLTPSISRLQGRGFVQSMVKVSSQLDVPASPTPPSMDRSRPTSASGRKSTVLDRWQPHMRSPSPTKSSSPSFSSPIRRSATQEPTSYINSPRSPVSAADDQSSHGLKSMASLPSLVKASSAPSVHALTDETSSSVVEPYQRSRTPGLGSATTMVLIKSSKSVTDLKQLAHVDELGVKHDSVAATSSKKPLIHPTKERARKPKKVADTHGIADSNSSQGNSGNGANPNVPSERREALQSISLSKMLTSDSGNLMQTAEQILSPFDISRPKKAMTSHGAENMVENNPKETEMLSPTLDLQGQRGVVDSFTLPIRKSTSTPSTPATPSFSKLSRVPSTGSRPTVMEVAKVLNEQTDKSPQSPVIETSTPILVEEVESQVKPRATQIQPEKRKSSYDKYSSFILPPLKEEATPTPTPVGTLNLKNITLPEPRTSVVEEAAIAENEPAKEIYSDTNTTKPNIIQLKKEEQPLPDIEVATFLKSHFRPTEQKPDIQTISVEVLLLIGTTARPITGPLGILYESEMVAVVHRVKLKTSGLASTSVWCWLGRKSILGDREERKLHELANRYGTSAKIIHQLAEPPELIQVLGGTLVIRQGTRTHWSSDNVTMHLVRSLNDVIIIDEIDPNVKNLCSAFSYCLTILGSIYIWHGCGSTSEERTAAIKYAKSLSNDQMSPIELIEGQNDDDEMFWMMLGNDEFAQADYWKWRRTFPHADPMIWRIEPDNAKQMLTPVQFISLEKNIQTSIYVVDCIWELFVLVGKEARSNKWAIRFALDVARKVSHEVASLRPFSPTLHVLVLPSRIPLDLQIGVRDFDEAWLNNGEIPDHMNLLSYSEATIHLSTSSWDQAALKDCDMLPLGVGLTDLI